MVTTSALTPTDFIRKTVGSVLFWYYLFTDKFRSRPRDLDDLVDGLLYLDARQYIEKRTLDENLANTSKR